jgi:hypothetical protein
LHLGQYLSNRNHDGAIGNKIPIYSHLNALHPQHTDVLFLQAIALNPQDTYRNRMQNSKTSTPIDDIALGEQFLKPVNAVVNAVFAVI